MGSHYPPPVALRPSGPGGLFRRVALPLPVVSIRHPIRHHRNGYARKPAHAKYYTCV